ncbi:unnamed protein product [Dibothriocephalus latus]|uniref:Uncharacterized protein n=1 Tax=Dibothriocephalus latus TaxID=60516 RepID=A0A3P7LA61_DIBLA|nr:unnamed protein product [Dibothriocephalus latus]
MSFESFIRLAEKNQAKNDKQPTSHGPQPTPYVPQKRSMVDSGPPEDSEMSPTPNEYVPSAPKRPRSPSNLMEALGVMTSTGLNDDKLQKPQYVQKIPRIPRKNSEQPIKATLEPTRSPGPTPNRSDEERPCRAPTQDGPPKLSNKIPKNGGIAAQLGTSKITVPKTGQSLSSKISSVKTQQPPKEPIGIAAQLSSKALPGLEKRIRTPHRAHSSPAFSKDRTPSTCTSRPSTSGATMEKSSKLPTEQNGSVSHSELPTMSKKTTVHRVLKPNDEKPLSTKSCSPSSQKPNLPDHRVKSQLPSHSARGIAAQQGAPVCGIAAQFGSLPLQTSRTRSPDDYSCDEGDDYASDDSFIDDSESMDAKDYSRFVKVIHKTLNFDPKRYANVSRYDDLSSMESNFRQIEKEERISARLGAKEDEEDIAAEAARRERRRHKLAA